MTRKQKRLSVIGGAMGFLAVAAALVFYALGQKTSYFYMPAELQTASVEPGQRIRLGGLVEKGFGVTLRELVEDFGGGTASGSRSVSRT